MARPGNARRRGGRGFVFGRPLVALLVLALLVATAACSRGKGEIAATETVTTASTARATSLPGETATPQPAASPTSLPVDSTGSRPGSALLEVHFLDVSLGNAVYIKTPSGADIVIDGGNSAHELSAFLGQIGEGEIDPVVMSHPDADHICGLVRILQERSVGAIWTNGEASGPGSNITSPARARCRR